MAHVPWTFEDHVQCARDISRVSHSFHQYIEEVHQKKAKFCRKKNKYKLNSKSDERFYSIFLFHKKQCVSGFNTFPCDFQGEMDRVLFLECADEAKMSTYYADSKRGWTLDLPPLSSHPVLTEGDRQLVHELNRELMGLMQRCIDKTKSFHGAPSARNLNKMRSCLAHVRKLEAAA